MKNCLILCSLMFMSTLWSNPEQPLIVSGEAVLKNMDPKTLQIQTSDRAIINWDSFSIKADEATKFVMPNSSSAVLNRVTGGSTSELMGLLQANGKVYLINPSGVIIGKEAVINAAGFVASTFDVFDEDFLQNKELLFKGESQASIINYGTIEAWDGDVVLLGRYATNEGTLEAPLGTAALAVGEEILLKPAGVEHIYIVAKRVSHEELSEINNLEQIRALQAELKADGNPYARAINQTGNMDALAVEDREGRIFLVADQKTVSKSLVAKNEEGKGGKIHGSTRLSIFESQEREMLFIEGDSNAALTFVEKDALLEANINALESAGIDISGVRNAYGNAVSEAFRDLSTYDDFLYAKIAFVVGYDRRSYRLECYPSQQLSSYDLIDDQTYNTLRQKYRNYNTKYAKSL